MANINSVTSNSYSSGTSLYGNRNVLTGLASGMDTEAMIQNSVTGYQAKITELQQNVTKLEWKQDAYRELTDQMYNINQKYMSFTSQTNLSSNAFFNNAITVTMQGTNAAAVSAAGKANSDIQINAVKQLATAARYAVDAGSLGIAATSFPVGAAINWDASKSVGQIDGTMTLKVGGTSIDLKFTEDDKYASMDELVSGINGKLAEQSVSHKGETVKASSLVSVELTGNTVKLVSKDAGGDSTYINSISGNLAKMLGASKPSSTNIEDKMKNNSFTVPTPEELVKTQSMAEYLTGKTVDVTLDGVTKQIKIGDLTNTAGNSDAMNSALVKDLQTSINKEFGANRATVSIDKTTGGLSFDVPEKSGSTIKVSSSAVGEALGLGKSGVSNFFNTGKTLGELVDAMTLENARMKAADGPISTDVKYFDKDGNRVQQGADGNYYQIDDKGEFKKSGDDRVAASGHVHAANTDSEGNLVMQYANWDGYYRVNEKGEALYGLEINGATIDGITKDTALESVLSKINSSADAGVKVSFSNLTNQFVFTASETGEGGKISFDNALAKRLFGVDVKAQKLGDLLGSGWNWDETGNTELKLGSTSLGTFSRDTTLEELMNAINSNENISSRVSYDEASGAFTFNATLKNGDYSLNGGNGSSIKAMELFSKGPTVTAGQDAIVDATVNGKELTLQRSSNVVNMDGLSVTLKEEFSAYGTDGKLSKADAVTFKTSSNADAIVNTVKSFVEDINKLMTDVYNAYSTQPLKKSSSSTKREGYEPLSEDDKNSMSESAVKAYEEKAKTGLLFGDTDLANLYDKLRDTIQSFGSDRVTLESIGLSTTYSNRVTTIAFDEAKLRSALESDPDKVRNAFTKTKEGGAATNGLITSLKSTINTYASTSIGTPGILVRKAGTKLSSLSLLNNNIQKQIDNVNSQIESWQTKLSGKIDYYTKQFTALEKLMSTMNNQSSMLADLMGY